MISSRTRSGGMLTAFGNMIGSDGGTIDRYSTRLTMKGIMLTIIAQANGARGLLNAAAITTTRQEKKIAGIGAPVASAPLNWSRQNPASKSVVASASRPLRLIR